MADFFVGLTSIDVGPEPLDLGRGVSLQRTQARFLTPLTLENLDRTAHETGQRPAYWQFSAERMDLTAELKISTVDADDFSSCIARASIIVFTIRLWCDPSVTMPVFADRSFSTLASMEADDRARVAPLEASPRFFALEPVNRNGMAEKLEWVKANWGKAEALYQQSQEFRIAADALSAGQFIRNDALALISLWGALEALFSPSTTELKFRVSALIAAYLPSSTPKRQFFGFCEASFI